MKLAAFIIVLSWLGSVKGQFACKSKDRLQLVKGSHEGEGRLEIKTINGKWSSVCPDRWTTRNAGVACQELCGERKYATSVPAKGRFGDIPSDNKIRIFNTSCGGWETSLVNCPLEENQFGKCFEDAAVGLCCHSGCDGRNMFLAPRLRYSASCSWTSYTVTVEAPAKSPDGNVYIFELFPKDRPNCYDQHKDANATHNWLTVPYKSDCGVTTDDKDKPWYRYKQQVLIKGQTTGPAISRLYNFMLPVACAVNRDTNSSLWIGVLPNNGTTDDLPPMNGTLNIDMVIKVYSDPELQKEFPTPVKIGVGKPIYVKLLVDKEKLQEGGHAKIIVEECFAIQFLGGDPNKPKHTIIKEQRAIDESTDILPSPKFNEVHFRMEMFTMIGNYPKLHLSCAVYVCAAADKSDRCNNAAANGQHKPGATPFAVRAADPNAPTTSGSIGVVSPGYNVTEPKLKNKPKFDEEDFDKGVLGPDDIVQIGAVDDICYLRRKNGMISRFRNRKQTSFKGKANAELEKCKKQT